MTTEQLHTQLSHFILETKTKEIMSLIREAELEERINKLEQMLIESDVNSVFLYK